MLVIFWVQADDVEMRGWNTDTSVNGQFCVVVSAERQQAFPCATRARDSQYCSSRVAGQELEYFDVIKLSTVLSSRDCGFKGQCSITFGAQPCAINRQRYASAFGFLIDIMTARVRNRNIYDWLSSSAT